MLKNDMSNLFNAVKTPPHKITRSEFHVTPPQPDVASSPKDAEMALPAKKLNRKNNNNKEAIKLVIHEASPIPHEPATAQGKVGSLEGKPRNSLRNQSPGHAPIGAPTAQNEKHPKLSSPGSSVGTKITSESFDARHRPEIFDMEPPKMKVFPKDAYPNRPDSRAKSRTVPDESSSSPASSLSRITDIMNLGVSPAAGATGKHIEKASQDVKSTVGNIVYRTNVGIDQINNRKSTSPRFDFAEFSAPPVTITQSKESGRLSQPLATKTVSDGGWEIVSKKKGGKKLVSTPFVSRIMEESRMFPNSQESHQKYLEENTSTKSIPREAPPKSTDFKMDNDGAEVKRYSQNPANEFKQENDTPNSGSTPASDQTKTNENDEPKRKESKEKLMGDDGISDQREPLDVAISGKQGKESKRRENKKKKKANNSSKKPTSHQRKADSFDDWESIIAFVNSKHPAKEEPSAKHNPGNKMTESKFELTKLPFQKGKDELRQVSDLKSLKVLAMAPNEELTNTEESVKIIFDQLFSVKEDNKLKTIEESWIKEFSMKPPRNPLRRQYVVNGWSELCKSNGLDLNFMHHLSKHLKVNDISSNIKLEKLDGELFRRIVSYGTKDHQLMVKVHRVLCQKMGEFEVFKRITTLAKQVAQEMISRVKPKIEKMNIDPVLFEDSKSGEYEKLFDIFGHYGLNEDKSNRQGNYSKKLRLETTSDSFIRLLFKPKYPNLGTTKREIYVNICGENEYQSRSSPRIHFSSPIFPEVINPASYEEVLEKKDLHDSLMSQGLNLNRLLTIVSILGLEDDSDFSQMAPELVYYKSKVLYKLFAANKYNPIRWVSTAERNWLFKTYSDNYIFQLASLTERLDTLDGHAQFIHDKNLRAVYSEAEIEKLEDLDEIDLKSKCMVTDPEILRIESYLPSQISEKLRDFEEVSFMLLHHQIPQ
ncbi:hypothetical protein PCASD_12903 [Puccinia coronata f. sp. avenae]|uniref:Uncharacterized protein n=1 Tax=Puccinia coronata f. sp. avenae TaxID=200324 RepID=A0A2N5U5Q0_9BASI|nr:hypothetical protein PCASD_12903 [Puccinia coronata f. sp. avenae]